MSVVALNEPSRLEAQLGAEVRQAVLDEIKKEGLRPEDVAQKLGLLPVGGSVLLRRPVWPLELAIRVAEAFNLEVTLNLGHRAGD